MTGTVAVILAAGEGKRMRSARPKVLHNVARKPMLVHVLEAVKGTGIKDVVVVLGHGKDSILGELPGLNYVVQEQQLGTGHAALQASAAIAEGCKQVLVVCGDTPLLRAETLKGLLQFHRLEKPVATVLTAEVDNPFGYGRIVRDAEGKPVGIVEERDADEKEKQIREINSGAYVFEKEELFPALRALKAENRQGEYYLTDVVRTFFEAGKPVSAFVIQDAAEIEGINDRVQLAQAERAMRDRKNRELMLAGVTIVDPPSTFIGLDVTAARDAIIHPFTIIEGKTTIGSGCEIGPACTLEDCQVGENTRIQNSIIRESRVGPGCAIGPFAYIRPGTVIGENVKVGDFVEIKNSQILDGSKVPHLSYVGDSEIGPDVNVGAGAITCNYDGEKKWRTIIEEGVFVGSNVNLVAPVRIGKNAFLAAGSTITEDVPEKALGVARGSQRNIEGWVERKKESSAEKKQGNHQPDEN